MPYFPDKTLTGRIDPPDKVAYIINGVTRLTLEVRDDDTEFIGNITLADNSQPFELVAVDPDTNPRRLYFKVTDPSSLVLNKTFNLQVEVRTDNCSNADVADVSISVMNLEPAFTEARYETSILEEQVYDTSILKVTAESTGVAGGIAYILKSATDGGENYFSVGRSTGEITVPVKTDAEEVERFILFIEAQDSSWDPARISFANVYVTVNDTNDNDPVFISTPPDKCIPEDYNIGRRVLTVTATDADKDDVLAYRLETTGLPFVIDKETGEITLNETLDVDAPGSQTNYTFAVVVSDGNVDHNQSVTVTICVTDVNDNAPEFDAAYEWDLPEEEEIDYRVFQVSATDADEGAVITYTLGYTSYSKYTFRILDDKVGNITVNGTFDREEQSVVEVIVGASDGKTSQPSPRLGLLFKMLMMSRRSSTPQ
ncbi:protocadherin-like wing polarity protein stan [Patiria miniata]|uniref:Cadherin domain-containing protein n=1 Tax=Patiria miniata TaxID=46514 RepID=A0A914ACP6_PATMI|nr:protocadherin-like wing polarity protein stan [Patiria miniata]